MIRKVSAALITSRCRNLAALACHVPIYWSMRIAIPQWQGRVSPVFDASGSMVFVEADNGREVRRELRRLVERDPFSRAAEFLSMGAEILICGAISRPVEMRLVSSGVRVIGFTCGTVEQVLEAFLKGELPNAEFVMPGCHEWRRRMGGRNRGPGGSCVCPNCGQTQPHANGRPCSRMVCPACGASMRRA